MLRDNNLGACAARSNSHYTREAQKFDLNLSEKETGEAETSPDPLICCLGQLILSECRDLSLSLSLSRKLSKLRCNENYIVSDAAGGRSLSMGTGMGMEWGGGRQRKAKQSKASTSSNIMKTFGSFGGQNWFFGQTTM